MAECFFVSDLHGGTGRYERLLEEIERARPEAVFLGGDMLPSMFAALAAPQAGATEAPDFLLDWLYPRLEALRERLGPDAWPAIFVIPGNDDPRCEEPVYLEGERRGLWIWAHGRVVAWGNRLVLGYGCVPPTPFLNKDWERYDVSRFVDPGCVSPEEGWRTVAAEPLDIRWGTIQEDLERIVAGAGAGAAAGAAGTSGTDCSRLIALLHSPPYDTALDRAALDDRLIEHTPVDVHVGSIAIRRFIEARGPLATLHGHIHESARLTGAWMERIGPTVCLSAAHDGKELALVRFDPDDPASATRVLL